MQPNALAQALLESYARDGGINHLDGPNLPSQDSVAELARDFMHVLFPGYFEKSSLKQAEVGQWLGPQLAKIARNLRAEVEKALRFAGEADPAARAERATATTLAKLPEIRRIIQTDVNAAYTGDPAARSFEEIILAYPSVLVVSLQRIARVLYGEGVPLLPRMITEFGHERTGVDIHPGATIGTHFFIDHGTGVVIGETAVIGNHVKIYQGVTLGAKSFEVDASGQPIKGVKRHPQIDDHVTIYAHATILGGTTRIGAHSVVGANVWLLDSIPANSIAYYQDTNLVVRPRRTKEAVLGGIEDFDWSI
ncbi:serine O-acetyltransferase EpsC [Oleiharenicola sp. Vm1]|uniref:serine O-acetyltransferase EpsC n=1 Tax=Oleiharenicola sp. Vm1 TaxID=3398393 RepID=UPI0039F46690